MRPIPSHVRRAVEIEAPQFVRELERNVGEVTLPWSLVGDDPTLLYNCIWYALSKGADVVIQGPEF